MKRLLILALLVVSAVITPSKSYGQEPTNGITSSSCAKTDTTSKSYGQEPTNGITSSSCAKTDTTSKSYGQEPTNGITSSSRTKTETPSKSYGQEPTNGTTSSSCAKTETPSKSYGQEPTNGITSSSCAKTETPSKSYGQEPTNRDSNGKIMRGPYESSRAKENWFIDAGFGAGLYLGGQNSSSLGGRINPVFNFAFGKMITPCIGFRFGFNYFDKAKEYFDTKDCRAKEYSFNYMNANAAFLWNLSNAIGGYKDKRTYQCVLAFGGGYAQICASDYFHGVSHEFTLNASVINKFRISKRVDLNLEISAHSADHAFDHFNCDHRYEMDVPFSTNLGVTIRLGDIKFKRTYSFE